MNAVDLIARENEFKKLNKQLEKKTESLMKEIERAMQKKDIFSDFSCNLTLDHKEKQRKHFCESQSDRSKEQSSPAENKTILHQNSKKPKAHSKNEILKLEEENVDQAESIKIGANCHCCVLSSPNKINEDLEFLYAFVSVNVNDKILPQSFMKDKISIEKVCKFLLTKINLLQEQIDKLQATVNMKSKQCEVHMSQIADLEGARMEAVNAASGVRSEAADVRAKLAAAQSRLDEKDRLYKEQRSETDKLTKEVNKLRSRNRSLEARSAAQEELVVDLRREVQVAKDVEKECRESSRSLSATQQKTISQLEARVKGLTSTIDKQAALIDNLRKQNALLTARGALDALEKDYEDLLNGDF